jgi:hypothetical protein
MRMVTRLAADLSVEPKSFLGLVQREALTGHLMEPEPGLLAALDQHAAAVRDALSPGVGLVEAGDLAAYARGVVSVSSGWDWQTVPAETRHWLRLRLASVCHMAHQFGYLAIPAPRQPAP